MKRAHPTYLLLTAFATGCFGFGGTSEGTFADEMLGDNDGITNLATYSGFLHEGSFTPMPASRNGLKASGIVATPSEDGVLFAMSPYSTPGALFYANSGDTIDFALTPSGHTSPDQLALLVYGPATRVGEGLRRGEEVLEWPEPLVPSNQRGDYEFAKTGIYMVVLVNRDQEEEASADLSFTRTAAAPLASEFVAEIDLQNATGTQYSGPWKVEACAAAMIDALESARPPFRIDGIHCETQEYGDPGELFFDAENATVSLSVAIPETTILRQAVRKSRRHKFWMNPLAQNKDQTDIRHFSSHCREVTESLSASYEAEGQEILAASCGVVDGIDLSKNGETAVYHTAEVYLVPVL